MSAGVDEKWNVAWAKVQEEHHADVREHPGGWWLWECTCGKAYRPGKSRATRGEAVLLRDRHLRAELRKELQG